MSIESYHRIILKHNLDLGMFGHTKAVESIGANRAIQQLVDDNTRRSIRRESKPLERARTQLADLHELDLSPVRALNARVDQIVAANHVVVTRARDRTRRSTAHHHHHVAHRGSFRSR